MPDSPLEESIRATGLAAGLDAIGYAPGDVFTGTRADLIDRKSSGLHGGMQFTYRNPHRSTDPASTLAAVRSLVVGARSYRSSSPAEPAPPDVGPVGRVARYARRDHYAELRSGLDAVADHLRDSGWQARVVLDDNALVDREAAHRAGLGWYGKSSNLLLPGRGSWFVLGSVLTDAPLATASEPVADGCGSCNRCIDGCPTGAIIRPGVVDARRCLAWLVQAPGDFPVEYRVALGDRLYGCDECQEVCPPNRRVGRADPPTADQGEPAAEQADPPEQEWVGLLGLLGATDEELLDRHGRWYVPRREPRYLRRNALVVLGNAADAADPRCVPVLKDCLTDPDPLIRSHAVWAARRLGRGELTEGLSDDPDPEVRAELARPVAAVARAR